MRDSAALGGCLSTPESNRVNLSLANIQREEEQATSYIAVYEAQSECKWS